jgi:hypothetical protein
MLLATARGCGSPFIRFIFLISCTGQIHDHENFSVYSMVYLHETKLFRDHSSGQPVRGDRVTAHSHR